MATRAKAQFYAFALPRAVCACAFSLETAPSETVWPTRCQGLYCCANHTLALECVLHCSFPKHALCPILLMCAAAGLALNLPLAMPVRSLTVRLKHVFLQTNQTPMEHRSFFCSLPLKTARQDDFVRKHRACQPQEGDAQIGGEVAMENSAQLMLPVSNMEDETWICCILKCSKSSGHCKLSQYPGDS